MKKWLVTLLCLSFLFCTPLVSARFPLFQTPPPTPPRQETLKIAVMNFSPPFVMQGAHHQFLGYDIALMTFICKNLNKKCDYIPMRFSELLNAVATGKVDAAIGAITITPQREQMVRFSMPYRISQSRFIGKAELAKVPFTSALIEEKKIGVVKDTIFATELAMMNLKRVNLVPFQRAENVIDALHENTLDLALMDEDSAFYWQFHSGGQLACLGDPITYGLGFGIAITPYKPELQQQINQALDTYLKSPQYTIDFQTYLAHF